jgi:hypothetical protein
LEEKQADCHCPFRSKKCFENAGPMRPPLLKWQQAWLCVTATDIAPGSSTSSVTSQGECPFQNELAAEYDPALQLRVGTKHVVFAGWLRRTAPPTRCRRAMRTARNSGFTLATRDQTGPRVAPRGSAAAYAHAHLSVAGHLHRDAVRRSAHTPVSQRRGPTGRAATAGPRTTGEPGVSHSR